MNIFKKVKSSVAIKAGFSYSLGNIFLKGIGFITIPIFTRMLTTSDYGIVNTFTAWLSVFSVFIGLGLNGSIANAKFEFEENFDEFISSILSLSTISFFIMLGITNLVVSFKSDFLGFDRTIINLLLFQSFATYIISVQTSKFNIENKYKKYLSISMSSTVLNVILSIIIIYLYNNNKYMGRIIGSTIVTVFYGIIIYIKLLSKGKRLVDKKYWSFALKISIPLMPHILSGIILSQFDRIMIKSYVGNSEAGIYSFTYNIGMILNVLWVSLNSAWIPWFYRRMNTKSYDEILDRSKYYIMLFSTITIGVVLISPDFIKIAAPIEYWSGINLVIPIALSGFFIFLYSLPANTEFFYKKTIYISTGTILSAATNIILNIIFIPKYGYQAAAYTTLFTYMLLFIFHWIISVHILKIKIFKIKHFIIAILVVCPLSILFIILKDQIIIRYSLASAVLAILLLNYKKIIKMLGGSNI